MVYSLLLFLSFIPFVSFSSPCLLVLKVENEKWEDTGVELAVDLWAEETILHHAAPDVFIAQQASSSNNNKSSSSGRCRRNNSRAQDEGGAAAAAARPASLPFSL